MEFPSCKGQRGSTHVLPRSDYYCSLFYLGRYLTGLAELRCKLKRGLPTLLGTGNQTTWNGLGGVLPVLWLHTWLCTRRLGQHTRTHTSHLPVATHHHSRHTFVTWSHLANADNVRWRYQRQLTSLQPLGNSPNWTQPLRLAKKKQLVPISNFKMNNTHKSKQKITNVDRNKFRSLCYTELGNQHFPVSEIKE